MEGIGIKRVPEIKYASQFLHDQDTQLGTEFSPSESYRVLWAAKVSSFFRLGHEKLELKLWNNPKEAG